MDITAHIHPEQFIAAIGMHTIRQENEDQIFPGVCPGTSPRKSGMAECQS
jgi:hypothetical protein